KVKSFLKSIDQQAIVAYTDQNGIITYVNDNFCDISGYTREELIGNTHRIVKSDIHPAKFYRKMWSMISIGQVWMGEICNKNKNGDYYWVNTTISPEFDDDNNLLGFFAIRYDITKEKLLEEQNSKLQQLSEAVQEMAKIGGWEFDIESEKISWTIQTYKIHEVPVGFDVSLDLAIEFYIEEDRERVQGYVKECIESGKRYDDIFQIITARGRKLWVRGAGEAVYGRDGKVKSIRGTFQDINDYKEAELKAENERKMFLHSAKLSTLGEMASSMIHEISNPLTVIQGVLHSAKRKSDADDIH
ncbi:unnamed protein product, partial [Chrysoparadoxa australica]